jgi:hypothetical protein
LAIGRGWLSNLHVSPYRLKNLVSDPWHRNLKENSLASTVDPWSQYFMKETCLSFHPNKLDLLVFMVTDKPKEFVIGILAFWFDAVQSGNGNPCIFVVAIGI